MTSQALAAPKPTAPVVQPPATLTPGQIRALAAEPAQVEALTRMEPYWPRVKAMLPKWYTLERLAGGYIYAVQQNPQILNCTTASTATALQKVAQWGLDIGETVHLVPDRTGTGALLQAWKDWKGEVRHMLNSGHVRDVYARVVREGDFFEHEQGSEEKITHRPLGGNKGPITHAYVVVKLKGGDVTMEVMTRDEVDAIRDKSRGKALAPWTHHYPEMAKKTVIKRIAKRMPKEVRAAMGDEDDAFMAVQQAEPVDVDFVDVDGSVIPVDADDVTNDQPALTGAVASLPPAPIATASDPAPAVQFPEKFPAKFPIRHLRGKIITQTATDDLVKARQVCEDNDRQQWADYLAQVMDERRHGTKEAVAVVNPPRETNPTRVAKAVAEPEPYQAEEDRHAARLARESAAAPLPEAPDDVADAFG